MLPLLLLPVDSNFQAAEDVSTMETYTHVRMVKERDLMAIRQPAHQGSNEQIVVGGSLGR